MTGPASYHGLLRAVLVTAIKDYQGEGKRARSAKWKYEGGLEGSALMWFQNEEYGSCFSFRTLCLILGHDADMILKKLGIPKKGEVYVKKRNATAFVMPKMRKEKTLRKRGVSKVLPGGEEEEALEGY